MIQLLGGTMILLASIVLVAAVWWAVASVLFPWVDKQREHRVVFPIVPLDDILNRKAVDSDTNA